MFIVVTDRYGDPALVRISNIDFVEHFEFDNDENKQSEEDEASGTKSIIYLCTTTPYSAILDGRELRVAEDVKTIYRKILEAIQAHPEIYREHVKFERREED